MSAIIGQVDRKRILQHLLFWSVWVVGFTFIKSFGMPFSVYAGWFVYYIITLPIFVAHTYVIVYWLIPRYFTKRRYLLFTLVFLVLFYAFSVLELLISNTLVFRYFSLEEFNPHYLAPGNVFINGVGNFYIVLVFMAARNVRTWFISLEQQKRLNRQKLALQVDRAIARVQPRLLLYSVNYIEKLAEKSPEDATKAIALTSEILSEVMMYNGKENQVIEKEVTLIKKLVELVSLFRGKVPDVEFFMSGDLSKIRFPALILFSFVEIIFREFDNSVIPEVNIDISGFSNIATIQVLLKNTLKSGLAMKQCEAMLQQFDRIYPGLISIAFEHTHYGCSIVIKRLNESPRVETSVQHIAEGI